MTKQTAVAAASNNNSIQPQPPLPEGWIRCHYYLDRKNRYCRQQVVKNTEYCGNHQPPSNTQRIPCPLDPSHCIDIKDVERHIKICPFQKKLNSQQEQSYYHYNVNTGGYGSQALSSTNNKTKTNVEWAQHLAIQVLQVHQRIFTGVQLSKEDIKSLSLQNVMNAIPLLDLSQPEVEGGLKDSVDHYRIKSGGVRHLAQQGSLVGHLRRIGVFSSSATNITILEMGAGRGMFGLMAAGVAAKQQCCSNNNNNVKLVLVERSGSRSKADGVFRAAKDNTSYMALNAVQCSRIACDLAHVHMPTVLSETDAASSSETVGVKRKHPSNITKTVVIAKHLCGAGTDLALKSLQDIAVDACVFATCCHGVCSWEHYVGRDFLKSVFGNNDFGQEEFDLMRRWTSGTVHIQCAEDGSDTAETDDDEDRAHGKCTVDDIRDPTSVFAMIQNLGLLECTPQGLGRACQRLLDQGRLEYMRQVLFKDDANVEMFHYVPSSVTPQNAVLIAYRK